MESQAVDAFLAIKIGSIGDQPIVKPKQAVLPDPVGGQLRYPLVRTVLGLDGIIDRLVSLETKQYETARQHILALTLIEPDRLTPPRLLQRAGYPVSAFDFGLSKYAANCHLSFVWNQAAIKTVFLKR